MNEMITVQTAAKRWDITPRRVQILCNEGRIDGAVKRSGVWFIPIFGCYCSVIGKSSVSKLFV